MRTLHVYSEHHSVKSKDFLKKYQKTTTKYFSLYTIEKGIVPILILKSSIQFNHSIVDLYYVAQQGYSHLQDDVV